MDKNRRFNLKKSLLRRAFSENRGPEVISEILRRERNYKEIRQAVEADRPLLEIFMRLHENQKSQGIRAANVIAQREGGISCFDTTCIPTDTPEAEITFYADSETMSQATFQATAAFKAALANKRAYSHAKILDLTDCMRAMFPM